MRSAFKFVSSACRLAVGGLRLPSGLLRGRDSNRWTVVSVDVFKTLIVRCVEFAATGDVKSPPAEGLKKVEK